MGPTTGCRVPPSRTGSVAVQVAPFTRAKDHAEEAERPPSRAAARAGPSASSVDPHYVAEAAEEEAQQWPPRAAAPACPAAATVDPPNVAEAAEEEAEPLQFGAVSGPSARRGALPNVPEPLAKKKARHLLNDNEMVIGYGAFFFKMN